MREEQRALRKFGKRLFLLAIVVLITDQVCGWFLRRMYTRQLSGDWYRASWTMDSTRAPFLVLGSSRASHHYIPAILDSSLATIAYNGGRDGNDILGSLAFFRAAIRRYQPEAVILELLPREMVENPASYERLSGLLPFFHNHPEIRDIVLLRGYFERWKLLSASYPFNSQLVRLVNGRWNLNKDPGNRYQGYLPLKGSIVSGTAVNTLLEPAAGLDIQKLNALREIAATCTREHIRLYVVNSPVFSNSPGGRAADSIRTICGRYGISYLDFSADDRFDGHPELFRDNSHLNDGGASLFTRILSDSILTGRRVK